MSSPALAVRNFALTLPETAESAAREFAERLRQQVRKSTPIVDGQMLSVTINIGIAGASPATSDFKALMRQASEAVGP